VKESSNSLPPEFAAHRVLPALVSALERGAASTSAASIIPLLLQLGKNVPTDEEYATVVIGPVVSLFASPDRGVRMALLDNLDDFKDKMDKKIVVDKVWPHLVRTTFLNYSNASQISPANRIHRYRRGTQRGNNSCDKPIVRQGRVMVLGYEDCF
jgi:hypothetical protein